MCEGVTFAILGIILYGVVSTLAGITVQKCGWEDYPWIGFLIWPMMGLVGSGIGLWGWEFCGFNLLEALSKGTGYALLGMLLATLVGLFLVDR